MRIAFIGTGSMGSLLIESLLRSGALEPSQIIASNRTPAKVAELAARHSGLTAASSNLEAAAGSDIIFLCIRPSDFKDVVDEIKASMQPEQVIVSITSPVLLAHLEEYLPCKIAKVIPSITNYVLSGATLCIYGSRMQPQDCETLEQMLGKISQPLRIEESYTRIVSDLSSCGPAFIAFLLQKFVEAAVDVTGIPRAVADEVARNMLLGTGRLLTEGGMSTEQLQARVSVPGGITAQALQLLEQELDGTFHRLIHRTHDKFEEDLEKSNLTFCMKT